MHKKEDADVTGAGRTCHGVTRLNRWRQILALTRTRLSKPCVSFPWQPGEPSRSHGAEAPPPPARVICSSRGSHFLPCLCFRARLAGQEAGVLGGGGACADRGTERVGRGPRVAWHSLALCARPGPVRQGHRITGDLPEGGSSLHNKDPPPKT